MSRFILTKRLSLTSQKFLARKWKLVYSVVLKNGGDRRPCVYTVLYGRPTWTVIAQLQLTAIKNNLLFISLQNIHLTQKFLQHQFTLLFSVIFFGSSKIDIFVRLSWALDWISFKFFRQQNEELRRQVNTQQSQLTAQQKLIEKHKETSQKCLQVNKSLLIEKVSMSNVA